MLRIIRSTVPMGSLLASFAVAYVRVAVAKVSDR